MSENIRWRNAQSYEMGYWNQVASDRATGDSSKMSFYRWRGIALTDWLNDLGRPDLTDGNAEIIEIGSGPLGMAGFFPARTRVGVDPLEDFFSSRSELVRDRPPGMTYLQGVGEALPVGDDAFDLAIMENCIDHCQDMDAVMAEIRRVLRPRGTLYLTVNCRSRPGYVVHRLLSRLEIDKGHPHTFTVASTLEFLRRHGFEVEGFEAQSWYRSWKRDLASGERKSVMKGLLGVSEFLVSVVARAS